MKTIDVKDAVGHILCHDLTRIIKGEIKGVQFRKGHVVKAEDIPVLLSMGKEHLFVWEEREGFLHEDEAVETLDAVYRGKNIIRKGPVEGKIEYFSEIDGLFHVVPERLEKINSIDGLAVATRHNFSPVGNGDFIAAIKTIPLVIAKEKIHEARDACPSALFEVFPYKLKTAGIIATGSEIFNGRINDTFTPVVAGKLRRFGIEVIFNKITGDEAGDIAAGIKQARDFAPDIILCTGGMSVDPDDGTPSAIKHAIEQDGGEFVTYGTPVLPGAMFLLAYYSDGTPILGLPGCVMFAKTTIFDIILPRLAAGIRMKKQNFVSMGHGGICLSGKGCVECYFPNCAFGKN
ncbi:MAG: molybdopterin-binding protein [Spirochaetaceae bacterium]|jgi:molybdopterin biosynthesis enzyme MoaB|nr:molybdopterin-binding protein [Spirochaetaceae bacterium]